MKTLTLLLLCANLVFSQWDNGYDGPLYEQCVTGESIEQIISIHDNDKEDRIWDFVCSTDQQLDTVHEITSACSWTGYVNDYDDPMDFTCPRHTNPSVITGVSSVHSNDKEDRIWDWYCCDILNCENPQYHLGPLANTWDQPMDYSIPDGEYFAGAVSYHDNHREDRQWQFRTLRCAN